MKEQSLKSISTIQGIVNIVTNKQKQKYWINIA